MSALTGGAGLRSLSDWPVDGVLAHLAGPANGGWRVVDVWESAEAFERFGEQLVPAMQAAGIEPGAPTVFPLHAFVA